MSSSSESQDNSPHTQSMYSLGAMDKHKADDLLREGKINDEEHAYILQWLENKAGKANS